MRRQPLSLPARGGLRGRRSRHGTAFVAGVLMLLALAAAPVSSEGLVSASALPLRFTRVPGSYVQPVFLTHARDRRLFIVERRGTIRILSGSTALSTPFLDIRSRVRDSGGEEGLLGLAFHPAYATNGRLFVFYVEGSGDLVVAEYRRSSSSSNRASTTERRILRIPHQPYSNHNGGWIGFGPDGYLYIATGDGGGGDDPQENAQNRARLLGKMLRIDVNRRSSTRAYGIPSSNPFVGRSGLDEIWQLGLRNPWRASFDRRTGSLWIGDVGQDRWEEVDRAPADAQRRNAGRGWNWGWDTLEGRVCNEPASGCSTTGLRPPLAVYATGSNGSCAVTGGYVYRGPYESLRGYYFMGDFCNGRISTLRASGGSPQTPVLRADTAFNVSSFGEDYAGHLYVVDYGGSIYRIGPGS